MATGLTSTTSTVVGLAPTAAWIKQNLGYDRAEKELKLQKQYLTKPQDFLEEKTKKLTAAGDAVGALFENTYKTFKGLGYPDAESLRISTEAAKSFAALQDIELRASFPEHLFINALAAKQGQMESTLISHGMAGAPITEQHRKKKKKSSNK